MRWQHYLYPECSLHLWHSLAAHPSSSYRSNYFTIQLLNYKVLRAPCSSVRALYGLVFCAIIFIFGVVSAVKGDLNMAGSRVPN